MSQIRCDLLDEREMLHSAISTSLSPSTLTGVALACVSGWGRCKMRMKAELS